MLWDQPRDPAGRPQVGQVAEVWPTWLANTVVHERLAGEVYAASRAAPENGQLVTTDIWARLGPDARLTLLLEIRRVPDGSLLSVMPVTRSERVSYGSTPPLLPSYLPPATRTQLEKAHPGFASCRTGPEPYTDLAQGGPLVPFTTPALLAAGGYQTSGSSSMPPAPAASPLSGTAPVRIYPMPQRLEFFHESIAGGSTAIDEWTAIDPASGRMVAGRAVTRENGKVAFLNAATSGDVEVYPPEAVPDSIFDVTARPVCHA